MEPEKPKKSLKELLKYWFYKSKETIFTLTFIASFFTMVIWGCEKSEVRDLKVRKLAYQGWCKTHKDTELTFEEWDAMREKELLPEE